MKKNTILQKCWVWNESVTNFVKERIKGKSLNVCAGKNPICDINMDLDPQDKTTLKGDMRLLPFESNFFDTVVSDPPWKIGYYERFKPFFECVRVCKVGGRIIYNATWIPSCPSGDVKLLELHVRQDNDFSNTSIISVFEKIQDNPEYNQKQEALLEQSPTPHTLASPTFPTEKAINRNYDSESEKDSSPQGDIEQSSTSHNQ